MADQNSEQSTRESRGSDNSTGPESAEEQRIVLIFPGVVLELLCGLLKQGNFEEGVLTVGVQLSDPGPISEGVRGASKGGVL